MNMEQINEGDNMQMKFNEFIESLSMLKEDKNTPNALELEKINPSFLTYEDMNMWDKYNSKTLKEKEFNVYRAGLEDGSASDFFARYIAEQIGSWNYWPPKEENQYE